MPDAIFADRRLVPLYDLFDGDRGDLAAYHSIVDELGASLVLDVGCGTGSLAIVLARHGHKVIGVDPAEASLDVARAKDGARRVRWIHGDAMAIPTLDADLATMTGNVAQVFLTDDDWARTLQNIPVERRFEVIDVSLPTVSFRFTYRFPLDGTEVTSESTLRFRGQDEVKSTLNANGYLVLDVRQAPDRPGQEFVFITKRST
jgi:SAM-dependent methyltransferase